MVRQGGHTLRFHGQLHLVAASFLTLALAISTTSPLYAETSVVKKTVPQGFSRNASYYTDVKTLKYYTSPEIKNVEFIVYGATGSEQSNSKPEIATLAAKDITPDGEEDYKVWQVPSDLTEGATLGVRTSENDSSSQDVVDLAHAPTLSLTGYDALRGGAVLPVHGTIKDGTVLEGSTLVARLLTEAGEELSRTTATRSGDDISASVPLPSNLDGTYIVELSLTHGEQKIEVGQSVSLMTRKPTVNISLSQDPPYAKEAFELYATPSANVQLTDVTLKYADQSVGMNARGDGSYEYGFPIGLASGTYDFRVVASDALGNTNELAPASLQKFLVLRVVTTPRDTQGLLPAVTIKPVGALSTDFAPLITPKPRAKNPNNIPQESDRAAVLGAESEKLKSVIDLKSNKEVMDTPLDTSSTGWRMLGVPWYLWLTGGATVWGGQFAGRWWFRRE